MNIEMVIIEFNNFVDNAPEEASFDENKMKLLEESGFIREPDEHELELLLPFFNKR